MFIFVLKYFLLPSSSRLTTSQEKKKKKKPLQQEYRAVFQQILDHEITVLSNATKSDTA